MYKDLDDWLVRSALQKLMVLSNSCRKNVRKMSRTFSKESRKINNDSVLYNQFRVYINLDNLSWAGWVIKREISTGMQVHFYRLSGHIDSLWRISLNQKLQN